LEELARGASEICLAATTLQGARDLDTAVNAARLIRDFCEGAGNRKVRLYVSSGIPLLQSALSTIDREVVDLLTRFEENGQIEIMQVSRNELEKAPRISILKGEKVHEFFGENFDQPIFDDFFGAPLFANNSEKEQSWAFSEGSNARKISGALSDVALNTKAFRYSPDTPRDFKAMFSQLLGKPVRLLIEDPYLAAGDRNRGLLVNFLKQLTEMGTEIKSLTLVWKPPRYNPHRPYDEERPEEQQRRLSDALHEFGLGSGVVHLKPRTGRGAHFHDRVIVAQIVDSPCGDKKFRWDITSGIDNLMEKHRQCSVFFSAIREK